MRLGVLWIGALTLMITFYRIFPIEYTDLVVSHLQNAELLDVEALIWVESRFRGNVVSKAGAYGLMQLMPETAQWLKERYKISEDWRGPEANLLLGILYFEELIRRYNGDVVTAAEAYNVGPNAYDAGRRNRAHRYRYALVRAIYRFLYEVVGKWS